MDAEKMKRLKAGGIDYESGIDRFGGNEAMFEKFISRFPDDTHYYDLVEAIKQGDTENGFRIAHTLKGVVGNLSFTGYYDAVTQVAKSLQSCDLASAQEGMLAVEKAHRMVMEALQE